jgi:hypothetical protein
MSSMNDGALSVANSDRLPILTPIALELTCEHIFGWLKMNPPAA